MGVQLHNQAIEPIHCGYGEWGKALAIAETYGWEPEGTVLTEDEAWGGGYCSSDFQAISKDDAENLSAALTRALGANESPFQDLCFREFVRDFAMASRGPIIIG